MLKITFTKISLSYTRRRANHIRAGYIGLPMVPLPRLQISAVHDSFQFLSVGYLKSIHHFCSYDYDSDSVASENQTYVTHIMSTMYQERTSLLALKHFYCSEAISRSSSCLLLYISSLHTALL